MTTNAERTAADTDRILTQWAQRAMGDARACPQANLQGRQLHIWCAGDPLPDSSAVMARFNAAMESDPPFLPDDRPIDRVFLYGIRPDAAPGSAPQWTVRFEVESPAPPPQKEPDDSFSSTERRLASGGHAFAIARVLSHDLEATDIEFKVRVEDLDNDSDLHRRLWVACESAYIPDPSLVAQPIARSLRDLNLQDFKDAAIVGQVTGEDNPEWVLRVDLTPPDRLLHRYASWGDVAAVTECLNRALASEQIETSAILKQSTLHLFCSPVAGTGEADDRANAVRPYSPERDRTLAAVAPILENLAPRGIKSVAAYGLDRPHDVSFPAPESPLWVGWLDLPAARDPELAASATQLAREGRTDAIAIFLERAVNPDLNVRFQTGGVRVLIRRKNDLLHVLGESLECPSRDRLVRPVVNCLHQLRVPGLSGVRIYARRSGQKQPVWKHGVDFRPRPPRLRDPVPEFAPSRPPQDLVAPSRAVEYRPQLVEPAPPPTLTLSDRLHQWLTRTPLFVSDGEMQASFGAIVVWGILGMLLAVQGDIILGQVLQPYAADTVGANGDRPQTPVTVPVDPTAAEPLPSRETPVENEETVFNRDRFIEEEPAVEAWDFPEDVENAPNFPSFNSEQLDAQLAAYQRYLDEFGVPDVLIVGSSRALRGIDPATLEQALAAEGYAELQTYNFGINGATAQVVDLLLRQILSPSQIPSIVIWADGARAFNSGRDDRTYESIVASEGYEYLTSGGSPLSDRPAVTTSPVSDFFDRVSDNYTELNDRLLEGLGNVSLAYSQRQTLKSELARLASQTQPFVPDLPTPLLVETPEPPPDRGFLPISQRFDPDTYYQDHPQVSGAYDADYKSFQLQGEQSAAFNSILAFVQQNDIQLIFVNLPLTAEYLDPVRSRYEEEFERYMVQTSREEDFIFRDFSPLWPQENEYFSDPSHLNRYGAIAVSERLARDPLIPWPAASP